MNLFSLDMNSITNGNLEYLKKIPKIQLTEEITTLLTIQLEDKIQEINNIINHNVNSLDLKYVLLNSIEKKDKIEKCILYLKKIK